LKKLKQAFSKQNFIIPFGVIMNIVIILFVIFTAVSVHFPWFYISKQASIKLITEINKGITKNVSEYTQNLFNITENSLLISNKLIEDGLVNINNKNERKIFLLSLMGINPNISWFAYGWENGDFVGTQRVNNGEIRYHIRNFNPKTGKTKNTTHFYRFGNSKIEEIHKITYETNYNATKRSWYKKAIQSTNMIWTPIYVFSTNAKPGLNVAITSSITDKNNKKIKKFNGVLTIGIELEMLSSFTKTIQIGKTGALFIIDSQERLIASKNFSDIVSKKGKKSSLTKIKSVKNNKYLQIIHNSIKNNNVNLYSFKGLKQFEYYDEDKNERYHIILNKIKRRDLIITTILPEQDFLEEIEKNTESLFLLIIFIIAISLIIGSYIVRKLIVAPISNITKNTHHIQSFDLDKVKLTRSSIEEINQLSNAINGMKMGLNSFKKYLPVNIVKDLIANKVEAKVGGEEKIVTIFFSDIANFTNISETLGVKLLPHLEEYFENMSDEIKVRKGTIDKYIGDAIMAFWNAPSSNPEHASDACVSAIKCQHKLKRLRLQWARNGKPMLNTRIGINTGNAIVGNIGSDYKLDYTILGDSVNLASRLEAINKIYHTNTIISENTYELAKNDIISRNLDIVAVKGKKEGVAIHELIDTYDNSELNYNWIHIYEDGLSYMQAGQLEKAMGYFERVNPARGIADKPSLIMIQRCKDFIKNNNFSSVLIMNTK
jgi:adenylate cyclase